MPGAALLRDISPGCNAAVMCNAAVKSKFPVPVFLTNSSIQISSPIVRGVGRARGGQGWTM